MKLMKKVAGLVLSGVLCLTMLAGCGSNGGKSSGSSDGDKLKVGIHSDD